jgi:hypothetical protein
MTKINTVTNNTTRQLGEMIIIVGAFRLSELAFRYYGTLLYTYIIIQMFRSDPIGCENSSYRCRKDSSIFFIRMEPTQYSTS